MVVSTSNIHNEGLYPETRAVYCTAIHLHIQAHLITLARPTFYWSAFCAAVPQGLAGRVYVYPDGCKVDMLNKWSNDLVSRGKLAKFAPVQMGV
jgi:hypothetical protein